MGKRPRKIEKKEKLSKLETNRYAKRQNDVMLYSMTRHILDKYKYK